jgi:glycerate 2-kinase
MTGPPLLLACPDKFRGSLSAGEVARAVCVAAEQHGWQGRPLPLADGGEGLLQALGGATRTSVVTGPLGRPVEAGWRLGDDGTAVVESAAASGLALAGGPEHNDPLGATSTGTGELVVEAVRAGARRVVVGLGGSAMSDGGVGAVEAVLEGLGRTPVDLGVDLVGACDVQTLFTEAARVFGPQKGADAEQVVELSTRLRAVAERYREHHRVDLSELRGGGAAGGLGGGLVVLGGRLVPGFDLVADQLDLEGALTQASLVVTGEGALDAQSFDGKVVGGVLDRARRHDLPALVVAGTVRPDAPGHLRGRVEVVDLTRTYGASASWRHTAETVGQAVSTYLAAHGPTHA